MPSQSDCPLMKFSAVGIQMFRILISSNILDDARLREGAGKTIYKKEIANSRGVSESSDPLKQTARRQVKRTWTEMAVKDSPSFLRSSFRGLGVSH
jgi:hypothetical protein